ncbi:MAG: hypothetical protein GXO25_07180, partial [Euryarchaeota archaeon]|nr:hypothetical protein [Euryarchaeota archaeon]
FVLVAVGLRLAFPLFGLEGRGFWIVATAPVSWGTLLGTRFGFALFLLLPLALALGLYVPGMIGLGASLSWVSLLSALAVALAAAGLGVGVGALWPAEEEGSGEIALGIGELFYMFFGLFFAAGVAVLDAYPVYRLLTGRPFWGTEEARVWTAVSALATLLFVLLPLLVAHRKLVSGTRV